MEEKTMDLRVMQITPALAAEWLEKAKADPNRPLVRSTWEGYAEMMRRGQWKLTHQGICWSDSGSLMDGQHRLKAITESGVSLEMVVAFGCSPDVFYALDRGKGRTPGQLARFAGINNAVARMAVARVVTVLRRGRPARKDTWSKENIPDLLQVAMEPCVDFGLSAVCYISKHERLVTPPSVFAGIAAVTHQHPKTRSFWDRVVKGLGVTVGDPAGALTRWTLAATKKGSHPEAWRALGAGILAWTDDALGKRRRLIHDVEEIPSIIGSGLNW
jgi:hypothetical protein